MGITEVHVHDARERGRAPHHAAVTDGGTALMTGGTAIMTVVTGPTARTALR